MKRDVYTYYKDGTPKTFHQYVGSKKHGDSAYINKNGVVIHRCEWKDDIGEDAYSEDSIQLSSTCQKIGNLNHGLYKQYYANGTTECIFSYQFGELHGLFQWYYQSGQVRHEGSYFRGNKHGQQSIYSTAGTLLQEKNYKYGVLHGDCILYSIEGEALMLKQFHEGTLIRSMILKEESQPVGLNSMNILSDVSECVVCMYNKQQTLLKCGHKFCADCLEKWKPHAPFNCPVCRKDIL